MCLGFYNYEMISGLSNNPVVNDEDVVYFDNVSGTASSNSVSLNIGCDELAAALLELSGNVTGTLYLQGLSFAAGGYSNSIAININL